MEGNSDVNPVGRVRKRSVYNSRRVWTYAEETKLINALKDLVVKGVSGIGLNSTTNHIDALPEVWEAYIKVDPTARTLKNKTFPFYADWVEIFGNDHATGTDSQGPVDAEHDVIRQAAKKMEVRLELIKIVTTYCQTISLLLSLSLSPSVKAALQQRIKANM
ncbi:hypothetical protein ACS0TY_035104 [Phlomoides rotata]